jgi:hypothetical protein
MRLIGLATARRRSWRDPVVTMLVAGLSLSGCAPLPKGEYWKGSYAHLDLPRYRFNVPQGWREVTASDFPSLAFNRHAFAALDDQKRRAFLQRAEIELQAIDTGLISARGAWIQVSSEAGSGWWTLSRNPFSRDPLLLGMNERQKQALWERFAASRIQRASPTDKPKLTLESIDVVSYGLNRVLRLRFKSAEARGSMYWTVLGVYSSNDTVSLAHLGTPEDRDEGIAGFEEIAASLHFD